MSHLRHTFVITSLLALLTVVTLLVIPIASSVAQGTGQLQARSTPTPTEIFDPPVAANPTATPPPSPDDPAATDELAPNPTVVPTAELPLAIEEPATLTIHKGVCDDVGFDPTTAVGYDAFEEACASPDGEFEFTVSAAGFAESAFTSLGSVTFEVPVGVVGISETIPAGWGDPAVFCWSDLLPTPSDTPFIGNAPTWDVQSGEQIECFWYNIATVEQSHTIRVSTRECPAATDLGGDYWTLATSCPDPLPGTGVTLTPGGPLDTDGNGMAEWTGVDLGETGEVQIAQEIPAGFVEPAVWCTSYPVIAADAQDFDFIHIVSTNGQITATPDQHEPFIFACTFFNLAGDNDGGSFLDPSSVEDGEGGMEEEPEDNEFALLKFSCPEGTESALDFPAYIATCTEQMDGIEFRVTSALGIAVTETAMGSASFSGLPSGVAGVQETIPDGYGAPIVFCGNGVEFGAYPAPTGHWTYDFVDDGTSELVECHVFNIPGEQGSITLLKWTCPAGYDLDAEGADPKADCTEVTNGVGFQFGPATGLDAEAVLQTTGDVIPGGVLFDGLEPGTWKAVEVVPDGVGQVFVLECTGHIMGVLQPSPLQLGNVLEIDLDAGEHLICFWFNVPEPDDSTLQLIKYTCTTETYVSFVDCQIEEGGVTFDLMIWNSGTGSWDLIETGVTDGFGMLTWTPLMPGEYLVVEHGSEPCLVAYAEELEGPNGGVIVEDLAGFSLVEVFNCGEEPGKPGDTPQKYPNTGVSLMNHHRFAIREI